MKAVASTFQLTATTVTRFDGRLAQRLERSPHTREVKGSNPLSPTIPLNSRTIAFENAFPLAGFVT
jgi:hypothetical protein